MKVLNIGSDRNLFVVGSEARERLSMLGWATDELHIIVFTDKSFNFTSEKISPNVWIYPTNSINRWWYMIDAMRLGRQFTDVTVVTAQDPFEAGFIAWYLSRHFQVKWQLQIHTDISSEYFQQESLLNRIRMTLAKFLLSHADGIRVVSQRIKNYLISNLQLSVDKIFVLPVFIDIEKIKQAPIQTDLHKKYRQFKKIILMASRLTREKNIDLAIEAMREIVKQKPRIGLIIVGSGPEEESLKLKVKSLKLEKNVMFEPWSDDLPSYYKTADLFLVTSLYEGYSRTIIEALASGCSVASTDVGIAEEAGVLIVDRNNLAAAILDKLTKPKIMPAVSFYSKEEYITLYRATLIL